MIPEDCRYTKEHEWVRKDGPEHVKIGITDFAQGALGDIVFVELPAVGTALAPMQPFGSVEAVKTVSELYSPVEGQVAEVNAAISSDPAVVNRSPYRDGWMIRARVADMGQLETLLSPSDYAEMVRELEGSAG